MRTKEYYQEKFDYYKVMVKVVLIASCLSEICYFFSDIFILKDTAPQNIIKCIIPRSSCIVLLGIWFLTNIFTKNYQVLMPIAYIVALGCQWSTIWTIQYLSTSSYAREGFIIMHFMFLALGFCGPKHYLWIFHPFVILSIIFSHVCPGMVSYPDFYIMMSLGIPIACGVDLAVVGFDKTYAHLYDNKKALEAVYNKDYLTGIYNRNAYLKIFDNKKLRDDSGIFILDIDHFKTINDTWGHEEGDRSLVLVVSVLKKSIRYNDILVRLGGDEFIGIFPNIQKDEFEKIIKRIYKNLNCEENKKNITISMGATFGKKDDDIDKIVADADKYLYQAKEKRNTYIISEKENE